MFKFTDFLFTLFYLYYLVNFIFCLFYLIISYYYLSTNSKVFYTNSIYNFIHCMQNNIFKYLDIAFLTDSSVVIIFHSCFDLKVHNKSMWFLIFSNFVHNSYRSLWNLPTLLYANSSKHFKAFMGMVKFYWQFLWSDFRSG